jgi:transposase
LENCGTQNNKSSSTQWLGRKNLEREALARSFVAKDLYRHPTTRDLIRALKSTENLRRLCGFMTLGDVPSESTFSRAFANQCACHLCFSAR